MKIKSLLATVAAVVSFGLVCNQASAAVATFDFNMPGLGAGDDYGDQNIADFWSQPIGGVVATAPNVAFAGYSGIQGNGSAFGFANSPFATDTATAFLQSYQGAPYGAPGSITLLKNFNAPTATLTFTDINRPYGGTLTFEVLQGSKVLATYTGSSAWTMNTLSYTPVGGEYISFQALNTGGFDSSIALTGVSITAVPEFSTWAMMLAGFASLGFVGYRRSKTERLGSPVA